MPLCAGCGEKGAQLSPSAPSNQERAYIDQGNARADRGDLAGAIADYTQALTLNPQNAMAYNNRGNAHADQGDLAGAIADYTQALTFDPQYANAYYNRGASVRPRGIKQEPSQIFGKPPTCISNRARPLITRIH